MISDRLKAVLLEDLECKKSYQAFHNSTCYGCELAIMQDDEFWYLGNGRKICANCMTELQQELQNNEVLD